MTTLNANDILARAKQANTKVAEVNKKNAQARAKKEYLNEQLNKMVEELQVNHPTLPPLDTTKPSFAQDVTNLLSAVLTDVQRQTQYLEAILAAEETGDKDALEKLLGIKLEEEDVKMPELKEVDETLVGVPMQTTVPEQEYQEVQEDPAIPFEEEPATISVEHVELTPESTVVSTQEPQEPTGVQVEPVDNDLIATEDMYFLHDGTDTPIIVKQGESLDVIYNGPEVFHPLSKEKYDMLMEEEDAEEENTYDPTVDPFASVAITLEEEPAGTSEEPSTTDYNSMFNSLMAEEVAVSIEPQVDPFVVNTPQSQGVQPNVQQQPVQPNVQPTQSSTVDITAALAKQKAPIAPNADKDVLNDIEKAVLNVSNIKF